MISKREEADRQFLKVSRKEKIERTTSKSRTITDDDKTTRDLKTANLKKQREARDAGEAEMKKGKAVRDARVVEVSNVVEFNEEIRQRVAPFSMGFVLIETRNNQENLRSAGSGTFVRIGQHYGILTAAHVASAIRNHEQFGIVRLNRKGVLSRLMIPISAVQIESCGPGPSEEAGPDIAFVKLAPTTAATIEAQSVFHNVGRYREKALAPLERGQLRVDAIVGVLDELTERSVDPEAKVIRIVIESRLEKGVAREIRTDDEFDYLSFDSLDGTEGGPSSYAGTSGGALWRTFTDVDSSDFATARETVLLGVVYYQSAPNQDGSRTLICHGPRSIYRTIFDRVLADDKEHRSS